MNYDKKNIVIAILLCLIVIQGAIIFKLYSGLKPHNSKIAVKAKIAIVIDDWGYNLDNLEYLETIETPLTIAILPNLKYSQTIAHFAYARKKEIVLHLPLQPYPSEKEKLEADTITVQMPKDKVISIIKSSFKSVPYAKGVSNHMGSKATEDKRLMGIIFSYLRSKKLYFLDSLVSSKSVCRELATSMGIKYGERTIFLDNLDNLDYIKSQLEKLAKEAKIRGRAVGIAHTRKLTFEALNQMISKIKSEGIKFVFVSEIIS